MLNMSFAKWGLWSLKKQILFWGVTAGLVLSSLSVGATEPSIPWQCTSYTYTEATQEECIKNYSGDQGHKIAELERQLKRQEVLISELRSLIERQNQQQQVQVRNFPVSPPSYGFAPPPAFGGRQFGFGSLLGLGVGLLPSVAIVID